MREKVLEYAEILVSSKSILRLLKELKVLFAESYCYQQEAACLEKMWNIEHKPEYYRQIGDIFKEKLKNPSIAKIAYNRYIQYSDSDFYKSFAENLKKCGDEGFEIEEETSGSNIKLVDLCDRFDMIVYLMIFLNKEEDYDTIAALIPYYKKQKSKVKRFLKTHSDCKKEYIAPSKDNEEYIADLLSNTLHRNDINSFVIEINPEIMRAYINILGDYITYKNYDKAIEFYNNIYSKKFDKPKNDSIPAICWEISDFYRDKFEFWQAVNFQKLSLEIDLGVRN